MLSSLDCFEVFLEKPSHLLTKAQSYSVYTHHQTVKYLIGITPHGTVVFLYQMDGVEGSVINT